MAAATGTACSLRTRQIGWTPNWRRQASTYATATAVTGRLARPRRTRSAEDRISPAQLGISPAQLPYPSRIGGRRPGHHRPASICACFMQRAVRRVDTYSLPVGRCAAVEFPASRAMSNPGAQPGLANRRLLQARGHSADGRWCSISSAIGTGTGQERCWRVLQMGKFRRRSWQPMFAHLGVADGSVAAVQARCRARQIPASMIVSRLRRQSMRAIGYRNRFLMMLLAEADHGSAKRWVCHIRISRPRRAS